MTVEDWLQMSQARVSAYGPTGAYLSVREGVIDLARRVGSRLPIGTNVFDCEWDLLILLDACRTDSLKKILAERNIDYEWETIWSTGSQSAEWMENTFTPRHYDEMARTAYVTGNPYTNNLLSANRFALLDEVWSYAHDSDLETVPPRPITDRAIQVGRKMDIDRLIVHYMQPHAPFIAPESDVESSGFNPSGETDENNGDVLNRYQWWNKLKYGEIDSETVWTAYMQTLRHVFNDVELLLQNVDAERSILSADHGNAFGEFGAYGHPSGLIHPDIRQVPWVETTATDGQGYEPTLEQHDNNESDITEMLRDLGYVD